VALGLTGTLSSSPFKVEPIVMSVLRPGALILLAVANFEVGLFRGDVQVLFYRCFQEGLMGFQGFLAFVVCHPQEFFV
jgi:hypothetical protein